MNKTLILKEYTSYASNDEWHEDLIYTNRDVYEKCSKINEYLSKDSSGVICLNGDIINRPSIFRKDKNEKITVNGYVGIINANIEEDGTFKNQIVNIGSRFDSGKEQYFLNYVFSKVLDIKGRAFEDMDPSVGISSNWYILLLMVFIKYLDSTKGKGLYRKYQTFEYNDSKLKGKIDIQRHIKENILENGKIAYSTREYTIDNSINHLILLANDQLEKRYSEVYKGIIKDKPEVRRIINELKSKILNYKSMDTRKILKETTKPITHPYYNIYENLRKVSIMILRRLGFNVFQDTGSKVIGIVVDMANLWEEFLEETIFKDLPFQDKAYIASSQDNRFILSAQDGDKYKREIKPDFTIYSIDEDKNIEYKAVFDAKYRASWGKNIFKEIGDEESIGKENWDSGVRNDVFQVMAYMLALNCKVGGAIFPVNWDKVEERDLVERYHISEYCNDRSFYTIPYLIPKYGDTIDVKKGLSYNEFTDNMEEQNQVIREEIINILVDNQVVIKEDK